MDLFCFSSKNEENIAIGYKHQLWGVNSGNEGYIEQLKTKAKSFHVESKGIIYCSKKGQQYFTMPFISKSTVDGDNVVKNVWPQPVVLSFRIEPLGDPSLQLPMRIAKVRWPSLKRQLEKKSNLSHAMKLGRNLSFQANKYFTEEDWCVILEDLAVKSTYSDVSLLLDQLDSVPLREEGRTIEVLQSRYERDPRLRHKCLEFYGYDCTICDMNFAERYGNEAEGLIHVHHLHPLSEVKAVHEVDPIRHLRPVCPNCHLLIHRQVPAYTIDEVKAMLRNK